jgi:hypothetical protein
MLVAVIGLALVFGLFFVSGLIPESVRHLAWVSYLRYLLLALFAIEGFPRVFSQFLH